MTQGLDRRMRYMERSRNEPLPWLKHKLYLLDVWTGAYMLDPWEKVVLTLIFAALGFYVASFFGLVGTSEEELAEMAENLSPE
mmetsp:Transcript_8191/g.14519  ORF Transcript_8191/g.14519 Transcript_8191/m.14519 type:complete len:83 (+) Transcript_8191:200-448(+)